MPEATFVRQPLGVVARRYDRMARWYGAAEFTILFPHRFRRRAVQRLDLRPGDSVMEIGCGTGRNLPLLCKAVGAKGQVIGVDLSAGMLARSQRWVSTNHQSNVRLLREDAGELSMAGDLDAVLFSLSYSVLPERARVLDRAWQALRPGGRLVIMDCGLLRTPLAGVLAPIADSIATVFPGDPYSRPWEDLTRFSQPVETDWFQFGIYFICRVRKPATG